MSSATDDLEYNLDRLVSELKNLDTQANLIGGNKDNAKLRKRLTRGRDECGRLVGTVQDGLKKLTEDPVAKKKIQTEFEQVKKDFQQLETTIKRKEATNPLGRDASSPTTNESLSGAGAGQAQQTGFDTTKLRQYDTSSLETEEAIQKEKLRDARDIEDNMMELKTCYVEFGGLVKEQQTGLDSISSNVKVSRQRVEKGTEELKKASAIQKKSRGKMCLLGGIIVVILIIVIVVVVVLKK